MTADVPVLGNRLRDQPQRLRLPAEDRPGVALDLLRHPRWLAQAPSAMNFANVTEADTRRPMAHAKRVSQLLGSETATWERFAELREQWQGPLVVKGIMTPEDAVLAADPGPTRSSSPTTAVVSSTACRPRSRRCRRSRRRSARGSRCCVDGGVRRGSDVVKARALGARACVIGRPWLYGLAGGRRARRPDRARVLTAETRSHPGAGRGAELRRGRFERPLRARRPPAFPANGRVGRRLTCRCAGLPARAASRWTHAA